MPERFTHGTSHGRGVGIGQAQHTGLEGGEGRDLGPVPVDGDLRLTTDPTGQKLTYEGQWETTIRMDGGGATEDVKVTVENSLRKLDEQIESFVAELNAARKNGAPDRVRIEGKGSLGDRPALQADVKVASLDAAFYADAFGVKSGNDEKKEKGDDRPRARADELLDRNVLAKKAQAAVDRLPDLYREAFVLRDLEELSTADVAQVLGVEPATVRQRVHRARHRVLAQPPLRVHVAHQAQRGARAGADAHVARRLRLVDDDARGVGADVDDRDGRLAVAHR